MKKLIFATHNSNKTKEIRQLLPNWEIQSLADLNFDEEIPETENTLAGNALLKARRIFKEFHLPVFADDSGLEVESLNGEPGVFSARYAGELADSEKNMRKLLDNLGDAANRDASFRTVVSFIDEKGDENLFEGICEGEILKEKSGEKGFGYDPIFRPAGYEESFAQMDSKQKNALSHRGKAIEKLVRFLQNER